MRLERLYGAKFKRLYPTVEAVTANQLEWTSRIELLNRELIDDGMERLKSLMITDNDYKWPDIAMTIALCIPKRNRPEHRTFRPEETLPAETFVHRQKTCNAVVSDIRSKLKKLGNSNERTAKQ